jgi:glycosyltransferase involved in cell wall biosynthesis
MTEAPQRMQPKITAVIPAYNEEKTIRQVVEGAKKHASEVLVIDDGSQDATTQLAISVGAMVIRIPRNQGKGSALSIGLTTAALNGSNVIVCLDGDGQHDPEDIPKLVEPIVAGRAQMVIGSRFLEAHSKEHIPAYRRVGQGVLTIATNLGSTVKITDSQSGYRAFNKEALMVFDYAETGMGIESEMVRSAVRSGLRIEEVPIVARYDGLDTSTMKPGSHGMSVLGSIVREIRTNHPLLYFGVSGMTMAVIGVVFGLYSVNQYVGAGALPFGPTLLGVMLISLGVVFVLVGLILNAISTMVDAKDSNRVS